MEKVYMNLGILLCLLLHVKSYPVKNSSDSLNYLTRFGYMKPEVIEAVALHSANANTKVREGLKNFQFFAGIPRTGLLDSLTVRAMNFPRCGNSELESQRKRRKRFVLDSRWEKIYLTYKIMNVPTIGPNLTIIEGEVRKAFSFWANEANIHVHPVKNAVEKADIEISFVRGPHNDGIQFDEVEGIGRVIAHAWKPFNAETLRGDMHFNDEVTWTIGSDSEAEGFGFDFLRTAIHEAGHALGLEHSPHPDAMMYFAVTGQDVPKLSKDDKAGIQELYGHKLTSSGGSTGLDLKIDLKKGGGGSRPIIVPSGTPVQSVPWECYRLQEQNPKDVKGIRSCYQDFYRDFYLSQG